MHRKPSSVTRPLAAPSGIRIALGALLTYVLLGVGLAGLLPAGSARLNLVTNGSFESGEFTPWIAGAWTGGIGDACADGGSMLAPVITHEFAHDGKLSARLGAPVEAFGHPAGASWIYQSIHVPRSFRAPELVFHYRIVTNDIIHWASFRAEVHDLSGQRLEVLLRDGYDPANGAAIPGYDMGWREGRFDLSAYRGETIRLYFESKNEYCGGWGIWTYLDDVRVINRTRMFVPIVMRNHRGIVVTLTPLPTFEFTPTITSTATPTETRTSTPTITSTATDTPVPIDTLTPTPPPGWFVWPGPSTDNLADVALASDGTAWAVGASGLILYFNGRDWIRWPGTSPTLENLTAVHVVSPREAWAVTDAGSIIRFDGTDWYLEGRATPAGEALWDIHMTPGGEAGWAVGEKGTVVWFDGTNWFLIPDTLIPTTQTLRAVYAVSADWAWAVGDDGTILQYVDHAWRNWSEGMPNIQTSATLWDVQLYGAEGGWIVGDLGTLMKYVNGAWYTLALPPVNADLHAVKLLTQDSGWAVGNAGTLLAYNRGVWTPANPITGTALRGIDLLTSGNGWAVGDAGVILRRGYASEVPTPTPTRRPSTPTITMTPTTTATATLTLTPTRTATSSAVVVLTPTSTPTLTVTASPMPAGTGTATPTGTVTPSPTLTITTTIAPTTLLRLSSVHTWMPDPVAP